MPVFVPPARPPPSVASPATICRSTLPAPRVARDPRSLRSPGTRANHRPGARRHRAAGRSITVRVPATGRQARSPVACNAPADAHPSSTDAALRGAGAGAAAPMARCAGRRSAYPRSRRLSPLTSGADDVSIHCIDSERAIFRWSVRHSTRCHARQTGCSCSSPRLRSWTTPATSTGHPSCWVSCSISTRRSPPCCREPARRSCSSSSAATLGQSERSRLSGSSDTR